MTRAADQNASRILSLIIILLTIWMWCIFVLWAPASIAMPLGRDQGIFSWVGTVILQGGLPYADAWDVKGPASHALYAVALLMFGRHEWSIRLFDLLMWCIAGVAVMEISRNTTGKLLAGIAAVPIILAAIGGDYWTSSQPDWWAGVLLLCCLVPLTREELTNTGVFLSGVLISMAGLIKPPYLLFILLVLYRIYFEAGQRVRRIVSVALGLVLPFALTFAVFAWAHHFGSAVEVLIRYDLGSHARIQNIALTSFLLQSLQSSGVGYVNSVAVVVAILLLLLLHLRGFSPPALGLSAVLIAIVSIALGWWRPTTHFMLLILSSLGYARLHKRNPHAAPILLGAAVLAFVAAIVQNKFWYYHFAPYWTLLALLAAFGLISLRETAWPSTSKERLFDSILVLVAVVGLLMNTEVPRRNAWKWWSYKLGWKSEQQYQDSFCDLRKHNFCYVDVAEVSQVVAQRTQPGDPVYLWGFDALVLFLSDRPSPTRFGFNYPLLYGKRDYVASARRELVTDLQRTPPRLIVGQCTPSSCFDVFPDLALLVRTQYHQVFQNNSFVVFERNLPGALQT